MGGMGGGGGGKGGGGGGDGGASAFDMMLMQKVGQENIQAIENRYKQLGLGQPSGDPIQAAMQGKDLTYAGPSTMEQQDVKAQQDIEQAAVGAVQVSNINNPSAPGSPANLNALAAQNFAAQDAAGSFAGSQAATGGGAGTGPGLGQNMPASNEPFPGGGGGGVPGAANAPANTFRA
jgi:hypothetical protein